MSRKHPSSLDYETLLHELALKNWRRSLLEGDVARATQNAEKLAESRDRFWRWQGFLDLSVTCLCRGRGREAREALESAKACFREFPGLLAPALEIEAHYWLETGRPHRTIEIARAAPAATPLLLYFGALASARLSDPGRSALAARELSHGEAPLAAALSRHVAAETDPARAVEHLAEAEGSLGDPAPSNEGVLIRFALAAALAGKGELERALRLFDLLLRDPEALLFWPIPFIRALFFRGRIRALLGDLAGASDDGKRFLAYWETGDIDRERVEESRQWVKA
jgi:hypothetical protein